MPLAWLMLSMLADGWFYLLNRTMNKNTLIVSMTTWPPRAEQAVQVMRSLVAQKHSKPVHFVLVLSKEEFAEDDAIVGEMELLDVEVIWDEGNIMSHKKLMPTLAKYSKNPILVVDDDMLQKDGWLQAFIDEHKAYPDDIIYGHSSSRVAIVHDKICEGISQRGNISARHVHLSRQANLSGETRKRSSRNTLSCWNLQRQEVLR